MAAAECNSCAATLWPCSVRHCALSVCKYILYVLCTFLALIVTFFTDISLYADGVALPEMKQFRVRLFFSQSITVKKQSLTQWFTSLDISRSRALRPIGRRYPQPDTSFTLRC